MVLKLEGVYTALVTPFTSDGKSVDYAAFEKLVDAQIAGGVSGLVPVGTTAESPTLTSEEKEKLIKICIEKAKKAPKKCVVIAGTGSNNTLQTVESTKKAKDWGVDAVLIVNPYYNKPSQAGLKAHVKAVDEVGVPIVLYNIPGRTGIQMTGDTIVELFNECKNVVAVKEATGNVELSLELTSRCGITVLSGDDALTLPLISVGGKGVISVFSNYEPKVMSDLVALALKNEWDAARKILFKVYPVQKNFFIETNPVPVKYAMAKEGKIPNDVVRLPLVEMTQANKDKVDATIKQYKA